MSDRADLDRAELEQLAWSVLDGRATDDDIAQLDTLLAGNIDLQQHYLAVCDSHFEYERQALSEESDQLLAVSFMTLATEGDEHSSVEDRVEKSKGQRVEEEEVSTQSSPHPSTPSPTPRSNSWLNRASRNPAKPAFGVAMVIMVAALVIAGATPVGSWISKNSSGKKEKTEKQPVDEIERDHVARLVEWHKPVWAEGTQPPPKDPRLLVGKRLAIESGLIVVKYNTGARVAIEGPAEFFVGGKEAQRHKGTKAQREAARSSAPSPQPLDPKSVANSGFLKHGSLVARVEGKEAQGFFVDTPNARVEDLGTEFGVVVNDAGVADAHVFEGRVVVAPERGASWERRELSANETVRVDNASIRVLGESDSVVASLEIARKWATKSSSLAESSGIAGSSGVAGDETLGINIDTSDGKLSKHLPRGYQAYTGQGRTVQIESSFAADGNIGVTVTASYFRNCTQAGYGDVTALSRSGDPLVGYNAVVNSGVNINHTSVDPIVVSLDDLKTGEYRIRFFIHGIYKMLDERNVQGVWDISGTASADDVRASFGFNEPATDNGIPPKSLANVAQVVLPFVIANDGDAATFTFTPDTLASNRQLWVNGFELELQEVGHE